MDFDPQVAERAFTADTLVRVEATREEGAADLSSWDVSPGARIGRGSRGPTLEIPVAKPPALLLRQGTNELGRVDRLDIELEGPTFPGFIDLQWAAAGEGFSESRQIRRHLPRRPRGAELTARFELSSHPGWSGDAERILLRVGRVTGLLRVRAARWFRRSVDEQAFDVALRSLYAIDVGHEVRPGFILPPGRPWQRRLELATGAELHIGLAMSPGATRPAEVSVVVRAADKEVLDHVRLSPGEASAGWNDLRIDLSQIPGGAAELLLTSAFPEGSDLTRDVVLVSAPELVVPARGPRPPNIVLISIDTLRADRMSLYGYHRSTTPRLDAWAARRAVVFEQAFSHASSTLPAHTSLFTGLEPLRHGAVGSTPAAPSLNTIADHLRANGYATVAVTGGGFLHPSYGLGQGFDRYRYWAREQGVEHDIVDGFSRAQAVLTAYRDTPLFLLFHTYEVHGPYRVRNPWARLWGWQGDPRTRIWPRPPLAALRQDGENDAGFDLDDFFGGPPPAVQLGPDYTLLRADEHDVPGDLYDTGVARVDEFVAALLDHLERLGLADRTIVVVTSDHGEALGENGLWSHGYLYRHNLHVPLLIAAPDGQGAGRRVRELVRLVDVAPTILKLAGVPVPAGLDGESLVPLQRDGDTAGGRVAWSYAAETSHGVGLRTEKYSYMLSDAAFDHAGPAEELYDLAEDPAESHNAAATHPATSQLRGEVLRRIRRARTGLRLELANRGRLYREGRLESPVLGQHNVKADPTQAGALTLDQPGRARFRLGPGESIHLRLPAFGTSLTYGLSAADGEPIGGSIALESLCAGRVLAVNAEIELRGQLAGPYCEGEVPPTAHEDPELLERLRALGYVH